MRLTAQPATSEALAPFGTLVTPPPEAGERAFYTDWLGSTHGAATPRLHVNFVAETAMPHMVTLLEKHPHTAQIFLPLEASAYLVVVAPSLADGSPDLAGAQAFVAPGNVGILYRADTWHAGATALNGKAHFAVCMWRNDINDEIFTSLPEALEITL